MHRKTDILQNLEVILQRLRLERFTADQIMSQLDEIPVGIELLDEQLQSIYINRAAESYRKKVLSEFNSTALLSAQPTFGQTLYHAMQSVLRTGGKETLEERFVKDSGMVWLQFQVVRISQGVAVITSNTTANHEMNRNLKRAYHLLQTRFQTRTTQLQTKNSELMDSINYARQIQKAFLPDIEQLKNSFPRSFMLLQPRDVLSGDFFWIKKTKDKTVLALVDCTGHGVPGALLSIIGAQALCDAVENLTSACKVLETLNQIVRKALKQTNQEDSPRDGMDIAVCIFDHNKGTLQFSGANRPLWYTDDDQIIQEIKGDRIAIGGYQPDGKTFTNHEIEVKPGCRLYMFSDGFADQDGGERGKKLKNKYFRKKIQEVQELAIEDQCEELKGFLATWKGPRPQLDDILVIGIEIP